jgi:molybdopterin-binding protein
VRDLHRDWGMTVIQVTHDFAEAGLLGDVAILLDQGRVLQYGPAAEVFRHPASPYIAEFLGAENVLAGEARAGAGEENTEADWEAPRPGAQRAIDFVCGPVIIHAMGDVADGPCHAVIRAEEVILSRDEQASSARNRFTGVVSDVVGLGAYARVAVDVEGVPFVALLTLPSLRELALEPGVRAHVSFKAFAVHLC